MATGLGYAIRQIALNGTGGAWTVISATITSRYAEAIEDYVSVGGAPQGLEYEFPTIDDSGNASWPGPVFSIPPSAEPLQFGDKKLLYSNHGPILGQVGQPIVGLANGTTSATPIVRMRSASATATTINFTEYQ
jgi:hypothetical protein